MTPRDVNKAKNWRQGFCQPSPLLSQQGHEKKPHTHDVARMVDENLGRTVRWDQAKHKGKRESCESNPSSSWCGQEVLEVQRDNKTGFVSD